MTDEHDSSIFEDAPPNRPSKSSPLLAPELAQRYQAAAQMLASEGENAMAKRLKPAKDDPRLIECRRFLQAITTARGDYLPILFNVVMREAVAAVHMAAKGRLPATLFGSRTTFEANGKRGIRGSIGRSFSVTPGKDGSFPMLATVMGRLFVLNALGYDIYFVANGVLYNHRCKMTCPWVRILIVELDNATMEEQERLLEDIRPMVVAAAFSGKKSIHMFVPLAHPIRNPHCIGAMDWRQFRALKQSGGLDSKCRVLQAEQVAQTLRGIIVAKSGKEPDRGVLSNIVSLTRIPGFRHGTGGLSRLLHADPMAKWDNPSPSGRVEEDAFPETDPAWAAMGRTLRRLHGGKEEATHEEAVSAVAEGVSYSTNEVSYSASNEKQKVGIPGLGNKNHKTTPQKQETKGTTETTETGREGYPEKATPTIPPNKPVLSIYVNVTGEAVPKRCFLDDLDDFERLLAGGIPGRHQRLKMHGVVMNATRTLGWLSAADADHEAGATAKDRLLRIWRTIMERTAPSNVGVAVDEAVEDFARHIDASMKAGKLASFRSRMPDFQSLPGLDNNDIERINRHLLTLMDAGILPSPGGKLRVKQNIAIGSARIIVGLLWPLAKKVPQQCLDGTASLSAARMRALCPSRRHKPVMQWLAEANLLRVTREDYARWDPKLGRGWTRLYRVNLLLMAWLAGVGKESLSWTATKASAAPQVALDGVGKGSEAAPAVEPC